MQEVKVHTFKMDIESTRQAVCICGRPFLDPVHAVNVTVVRGTATPTLVKR